MAQESPLERAVNLARAKRYAEAREALTGVAEPSDGTRRIAFHRLKAAVASGLGDNSQAADEMRLALAIAPKDAGLLMATAAAELQAERLDDALHHVRSAGNTALAQALTGDIYEKRGDYVNAANAYRAAVSLAPESEQYRLALALELVQHQTFEPARQVLQQAAPAFPKSARIRTLLGIAHYAMGHVEEAQASLADAMAVDPTLAPAYTYLARIALEAAGAPLPRTIKVLCLRDGPVCHALQSRAGDSSAISRLKQDPPDSAIARCELGRAYDAAGNQAEARTEMEICVSLEPLPANHFRLGRIYERLGLTELAHTEMEKRNAAAARLNDEVSRRESAVQAFRYLTAK